MTSKTQQRNLTFVVVVGVIAVLAAVAVIIVSSNSASATGRDYSSIPQSRTADGAFVLGYEDAPITIVEFSDFTCPHCQQYAETIHRVIDEFVATGKAKLEYRMFPIVHPQYREFTAELAECAETVVRLDEALNLGQRLSTRPPLCGAATPRPHAERGERGHQQREHGEPRR